MGHPGNKLVVKIYLALPFECWVKGVCLQPDVFTVFLKDLIKAFFSLSYYV